MRTLLALLLTSVAFAAPILKDKKPTLYHATEVGTVLEYETKTGDNVSTTTETISAVETKDGKTFVTLARNVAGREVTTKLQVSEAGVTQLETNGKALAAPQQMLKLPLKANEEWEGPAAAGPANSKMTFKTIGEEEIEVPAGKFKAIRIEMVASLNPAGGGGLEIKQSQWYAPGVGLVKMSMSTNQAGIVAREQVLKSIKAPKK